jgi:hypothetical protein
MLRKAISLIPETDPEAQRGLDLLAALNAG